MDESTVLRIEIQNGKPVELADFTVSMAAFADAFKDYATATSGDPLPDNLRLYVKTMSEGSIIAEMIALTEQAQFIFKNAEVLAGFVANLNEVTSFFLGRPARSKENAAPSVKMAKQIAAIVEPIAKDNAAQMNVSIAGDVHLHLDHLQANAVQNAVARFVGPRLPSNQFASDQLLILEQVKNSATAKSGDRGVIEQISSRPVRLQFSSEQVKRQILELTNNPFQQIFQVNVEVRSVEGKPAMYRIIEVLDVFPKSE